MNSYKIIADERFELVTLPKVDRSQLAAQMAEIASVAQAYPMSQASIESCFGSLYTNFAIVNRSHKEDKLVGFAILHQIFEDATLMEICVQPEYQGQGLGVWLLQVTINQAIRSGAEQLLLEVRSSNQVAINLYKKLGFIQGVTRKGYYPMGDGREDGINMCLPLQ